MTLEQFFKEHPRGAVAFSGGVDSAYLLYAAKQAGAAVKAYYLNSAFQPRFELDDARRVAAELGVRLEVLEADILSDSPVSSNPPERCYFCKKRMFRRLMEAAEADGFSEIFDGTNASDDAADRPGMRALAELGIRSPLRECGLSKAEIRSRSQAAGLFTWDKPAYACLATRIPTGEALTAEKLERTERAEAYLASLGFRNFRVRSMGETAKIQLPASQFPAAVALRETIVTRLVQDYQGVLLDLEARDEQ